MSSHLKANVRPPFESQNPDSNWRRNRHQKEGREADPATTGLQHATSKIRLFSGPIFGLKTVPPMPKTHSNFQETRNNINMLKDRTAILRGGVDGVGQAGMGGSGVDGVGRAAGRGGGERAEPATQGNGSSIAGVRILKNLRGEHIWQEPAVEAPAAQTASGGEKLVLQARARARPPSAKRGAAAGRRRAGGRRAGKRPSGREAGGQPTFLTPGRKTLVIVPMGYLHCADGPIERADGPPRSQDLHVALPRVAVAESSGAPSIQ